MCLALAVGVLLCGGAACVRHNRHAATEQGKTADAVQADNAGSAAAQPDADSPDAKEVKRLQKAADKGNVKAQSALGRMYVQGQGVPQDYAKAAELLQKAADKGDVKAQVTLAAMYGMGQGVPQDYAKAAELLQKAADKGEPQAQALLGRMYAAGAGVTKDVTKGCELLRKAAAKGEPSAPEGIGVFCGGDKGADASDSGSAADSQKEQQ